MIILILIFIAHFLGDFVFQSDFVAKYKSKHIVLLVQHIFEYAITFIGIFGMLGIYNKYYDNVPTVDLLFIWIGINCVIHLIQDYFTSRLNKFLFSINNHYGFVGIGLDQMLHYIILILSYQYLIGFKL